MEVSSVSLVETLKATFTSESKAVYLCEDCDGTFEVAPDAEAPSCSACGSDEVQLINRV